MDNLVGLEIILGCISCGVNKTIRIPATNIKILKAGLVEPTCSCRGDGFLIESLKQIKFELT